MPTIVQGVTVENLLVARRMLVEWELNPSAEVVTAYEIHRSTIENDGYEKIAEVNSPYNQFIDKVPFTFGVSFYYKVLARDNAGLRSDIVESPPVSDVTFDQFEERPFRATTVSFDDFAVGEAPTGTIDGINVAFTSASLYRFNTTEVFVNGIKLVRGTTYSENNDQLTLTLTTPPPGGATVSINYIKV